MAKRDIISSLFLLALAAFFVAGSFMYSIWSRHGPGPGLFPLLFGILLGLLSLGLLIDATRRLHKEKNKEGAQTDVPRFANTRKIAAFLVLCVGVYLAMRPLGFVITVFLFLAAALALAGQPSLKLGLTVAAIASVSMFLLFRALNVPLPLGPFQSLAGLG